MLKNFPEISQTTAKRSSWWLAGLAVFCDWLGSNQKFFPYEKQQLSLGDYWQRAKKQATKALAQVGMLQAQVSDKLSLSDLLKTDAKIKATPLQQTIIDQKINSTLFILEDVAGAGKSEATLLLAHKLMKAGQGKGIYFALPTIAT